MIRRAIALTVAALTSVLATTAIRTMPAHAATAYASCNNDWVAVKNYNKIPVYSSYSSTKVLRGYLVRHTIIACERPMTLGSRYNGCGATNANAWLYVVDTIETGLVGWTYATCLED